MIQDEVFISNLKCLYGSLGTVILAVISVFICPVLNIGSFMSD